MKSNQLLVLLQMVKIVIGKVTWNQRWYFTDELTAISFARVVSGFIVAVLLLRSTRDFERRTHEKAGPPQQQNRQLSWLQFRQISMSRLSS